MRCPAGRRPRVERSLRDMYWASRECSRWSHARIVTNGFQGDDDTATCCRFDCADSGYGGGGLALRMAPLGLPAFVVKYGGSTLWAVMIYWIASTALARWRPVAVAPISGMIATAVEFFKLISRREWMRSARHWRGNFCWGGTSRGGILPRIGQRSPWGRCWTGSYCAGKISGWEGRRGCRPSSRCGRRWRGQRRRGR